MVRSPKPTSSTRRRSSREKRTVTTIYDDAVTDIENTRATMPKRKRRKQERTNRNTVSDQDNDVDDVVQEVNAPTPGNKYIEKQVELLLNESHVSTILDTFLAMEMNKEENQDLRKGFEKTNLVINLIKVLETLKKNQREDIALKIILIIDLFSEYDPFKRDFLEKGAIAAVAETMKLFPRKKLIQEVGCGAIANVSFVEGGSIINFINDDILIMVADVMRKYPKTIDIQFYILAFLCSIIDNGILFGNDEIINKLIGMKFVELTLNVLQNNDTGLVTIFEWSCKLLLKLIVEEKVKAEIREKDGTLILAKIENVFRKKSNDKIADLALQIITAVSTYKVKK